MSTPNLIVAGREIAWAAAQHRDRIALTQGGRNLTFREVDRRANRLANALRDLGHGLEERVAVLLPNRIEVVDWVFGLTKGGFCIVSLNTRHAAREHVEILEDSGATVLVADARFADVVEEVRARVPVLRTVVGVDWQPPGGHEHEALLADASDADPALEIPDTTICRLTYTSGTTGKSKGVVGNHRRHLARLDNFFASCEYALGREHTMAQVGPLSHVAGNYLQPCFMRGARTLILDRFDPVELQATIERERVDHLLLVPTMIVRFVDALDPDRFDLSSLTRINYGTAPIPVEVLRKGIALLGPVFRQHYGMSEAQSPLTLLYPDEHVVDGMPEEVARLASCGRPVVGHDIRVRDDGGRDLPPGEVGEIVIRARGAAEMEYWRRPDLTVETVRDGWLMTGDLGRFDADGYLFIVGRKKDMIITGGFNVYAREVEDALHRHPDVLEAAVVGVPDREWGEVITALVVPRAGVRLTAEDVDSHCHRELAGYKVPRLVDFADEVPKNLNGKVAKEEVRQRLAALHAPAAADEVSGVGAYYGA